MHIIQNHHAHNTNIVGMLKSAYVKEGLCACWVECGVNEMSKYLYCGVPSFILNLLFQNLSYSEGGLVVEQTCNHGYSHVLDVLTMKVV